MKEDLRCLTLNFLGFLDKSHDFKASELERLTDQTLKQIIYEKTGIPSDSQQVFLDDLELERPSMAMQGCFKRGGDVIRIRVFDSSQNQKRGDELLNEEVNEFFEITHQTLVEDPRLQSFFFLKKLDPVKQQIKKLLLDCLREKVDISDAFKTRLARLESRIDRMTCWLTFNDVIHELSGWVEGFFSWLFEGESKTLFEKTKEIVSILRDAREKILKNDLDADAVKLELEVTKYLNKKIVTCLEDEFLLELEMVETVDLVSHWNDPPSIDRKVDYYWKTFEKVKTAISTQGGTFDYSKILQEVINEFEKKEQNYTELTNSQYLSPQKQKDASDYFACLEGFFEAYVMTKRGWPLREFRLCFENRDNPCARLVFLMGKEVYDLFINQYLKDLSWKYPNVQLGDLIGALEMSLEAATSSLKKN